jgi:NAD(P)-dependent dehydrogenase (short-subunit alcohol dehydrogenase family)
MSKRILITGAARGIGAEAARRLAARGHRLALLGLEPEELEAVAAACGGDTPAIEVDVLDRDALRAAVDRAADHLGGLDVVVANAGIANGGMMRTIDEDLWERVVDINLKGVFRTIRAGMPHLIASRGYALPVASMAAVAHAPMLSAYCASKAGVEAFANAARIELKPHGVDVGCAYFSWIDTDMVRGAQERPSYRAMRASLRPPFSRTYPLEGAAEAVVRGVERRARIVAAPGWIRTLLPFRGLVQPIAERQAGPHIPEVERLWEQEVAEDGVLASAPTGAGGAAAWEAPTRT